MKKYFKEWKTAADLNGFFFISGTVNDEIKITTATFRKANLYVIVSVEVQDDEKKWMHLSFSKPNRLPTYDEMKRLKDIFIGKERKAVQVFPPESKFVNIHPYCLHLWCCLDGDPLPDFDKGGVI